MFYLSDLKEIINNSIYQNVIIRGVSIDTRTISKGDLFIAIKGKTFDGHDYIENAILKGASAIISSKRISSIKKIPMILVRSTRLFLGDLANWWRKKFKVKVIAITGSNGKTTVKEMIVSILGSRYKRNQILYTQGNYNNDIGVPLTLLQMSNTHEYAVIEMGMNNSGEISYLTKMAMPDFAVINNVGSAHIGNFNSKENIADAKIEIVDGLNKNGTLILNKNDEFQIEMTSFK